MIYVALAHHPYTYLNEDLSLWCFHVVGEKITAQLPNWKLIWFSTRRQAKLQSLKSSLSVHAAPALICATWSFTFMLLSQLSSSYQLRAFTAGKVTLAYGSLGESASTCAASLQPQPVSKLPFVSLQWLFGVMSKLGCDRVAKESCDSIHTIAKKGVVRDSRQAEQKQTQPHHQSVSQLVSIGQHLHLLSLIILFDGTTASKYCRNCKMYLEIIRLMLRRAEPL